MDRTDHVEGDAAAPARRRGTATSNFGVGKREGHDASGFYDRFVPPVLSDDADVSPHRAVDEIWVGDSRDMDTHGEVADGSVALVVTSPPYFAGKAYEEALGEGGIPGDYLEYLGMLRAVFAECVRKLEPGGRIAVNVANLGRKPYRSLSSDVIAIFEELGLLLRGEIIWQKGRGAGGSCAWGSFQRPGNPVLRDVTERVVVASKGRFDRAVPAKRRARDGMPSVSTISVDDFLESTLDVWELAPESARRVNHPAPFPVELPQRLMELYTYEGDLVLDPFMGAGSTAVAAVRTGRRYVGFDTDPEYVAIASTRVAEARSELLDAPGRRPPVAVAPGGHAGADDGTADAALRAGRRAAEVAARLLAEAGFAVDERAAVRELGLEFDLRATGADGVERLVLVAGAFTPSPSGLRRTDVLWRTLAHAGVVAAAGRDERVLVLTTELPARSSPAAKALAAAVGTGIEEVVVLTDPDAATALAALHRG